MKSKRITRKQVDDIVYDKFLERLDKANKAREKTKENKVVRRKDEYLKIEPIDL